MADSRIISDREFAEFARDPHPTPQKRMAYGWSRTLPYSPYQPSAPKIFYAAIIGPVSILRPLLECVRQAIRLRRASAATHDQSAWIQTHPVSEYNKSKPTFCTTVLHYQGPVRGFRGKLELLGPPTHTITLEAFVHYNTVSPDPANHHTVLCLEFNDDDRRGSWRYPESERQVSETIAPIARRIHTRFPAVDELLLLAGGWRYVAFDIPYYGSELAPKTGAAGKA